MDAFDDDPTDIVIISPIPDEFDDERPTAEIPRETMVATAARGRGVVFESDGVPESIGRERPTSPYTFALTKIVLEVR